MANDYPIVGVGLDNFTLLFQHYAPNPEDVHVAHNTYLQILAEAGYFGLALYLLLLTTAFWTFEVARRRARLLGYAWAESGARYLSASLLAFLVGGTFLNRAHFDLTYHVMILGACLLRIVTLEWSWQRRHPRDKGQMQELHEQTAEEAQSQAAGEPQVSPPQPA
jgi:O-antigen ligase